MTHRMTRGFVGVLGIGLLTALSHLAAQGPGSSTQSALPDDWPTYNRTHAGERFSPLAELTAANVGRLRQVCLFDTGEQVSFQTGPLVIAGVMYVTSDTMTYALDAATCAVKWKQAHAYRPTTLGVNRGAAFDGGRVFRGAGTGHVLALDPRRASWRGTWN